MQSVSLVEFRKNAAAILRRIERGEPLVLTRRGRPVVRLEPIAEPVPSADDPFYRLAELAAGGGETLENDEIDRVVYGL